MQIDVVQLNIVIALCAIAFAARVADRERRPQGSSPTRVSLVRLLAAARRRHESQSTTRSRSISITCFVALVLAAGMTVGCARSPGVPSGAARINEDRDHEWAWTRKSPAVEPQPQTASSGNRESHT
jgi:hypothetical protein